MRRRILGASLERRFVPVGALRYLQLSVVSPGSMSRHLCTLCHIAGRDAADDLDDALSARAQVDDAPGAAADHAIAMQLYHVRTADAFN